VTATYAKRVACARVQSCMGTAGGIVALCDTHYNE
jgi:hypothetical protein